MKKIILFLLVMAGVGCVNFLDTEPMTQKTSGNYPQTPDEAYTALMGVYNAFGARTGNDEWQHPFILMNLMSDDMFGGGGQGDTHAHAMALFKLIGKDMYSSLWSTRWRAVYRANLLLGSLDNVPWKSAADRNKIEAQVLFLRAYSFFTLSSLFGPVPLTLDAKPQNLPRAEPSVLYGQMAEDLKKAIERFESIPYHEIPLSENGLANRWAAEALMARIFLFYTGYYNQTTMGSVSKTDVIGWVDDCVKNSGYDLISDFRNLWPYSVVVPGKTKSDYPYAAKNNLKWIGEEGANNETMFAIKVSTSAINNNYDRRNSINLNFGLRGGHDLLPFGSGWGLGPASSKLWEEWPDGDPRKVGSICDVTNPDEGPGITTKYGWGWGYQWHETGYWSKKYMPVNVLKENGDITSYSSVLYGIPNDPQFNSTQDIVLIRFADVLLMGAELGSADAQSDLDRVRSRVGLPSVAPTLENIKSERRFELAFEATRWLDLLRWHDVAAAVADMNGTVVKNDSQVATLKVTYRPETGGFLPIPESEIALSEGVLTQTPGWSSNDAMLQPGE